MEILQELSLYEIKEITNKIKKFNKKIKEGQYYSIVAFNEIIIDIFNVIHFWVNNCSFLAEKEENEKIIFQKFWECFYNFIFLIESKSEKRFFEEKFLKKVLIRNQKVFRIMCREHLNYEDILCNGEFCSWTKSKQFLNSFYIQNKRYGDTIYLEASIRETPFGIDISNFSGRTNECEVIFPLLEENIRNKQRVSAKYETAKGCIIDCLIEDYRVSPKDAEEAVEKSRIKNLFEQNEDMAAHTSNEDYAEQIYNAFLKAKT